MALIFKGTTTFIASCGKVDAEIGCKKEGTSESCYCDENYCNKDSLGKVILIPL